MSALEAQRLAEQTGSLYSEAKSVLEAVPDFEEAKQTLNSVLVHRRNHYKEPVLAVWAQFAPVTTLELGIEETINFIQSLGLELEDQLVLGVAYELQAPETGVFLQQQFIDGFARNEARTLEEFKNVVIPNMKKNFDTVDYFRLVYRFTYKFVLASEKSRRNLDLETANAYWKLLLEPRYPEVISKWIEFTENSSSLSHGVSADTWNMLLEFCEFVKSDPQLEKYDESSAWPTVIDDFVEENWQIG